MDDVAIIVVSFESKGMKEILSFFGKNSVLKRKEILSFFGKNSVLKRKEMDFKLTQLTNRLGKNHQMLRSFAD